mmetsp:Transcript_32837/g.29134  ORF Transcript_32837/g.29134 Transcript_32837/m.29134 type:complete len:144 (+) Transcript_32837:584-1015(+)
MKENNKNIEITQANEKEYIRSQEISNRLEGDNPISNNQIENIDSKHTQNEKKEVMDQKFNLNERRKSEDSVRIKLNLSRTEEKEEFKEIKTSPFKPQKEEILVSTEPKEFESPIKAHWRTSAHESSHPALQIENEEADKLGGM